MPWKTTPPSVVRLPTACCVQVRPSSEVSTVVAVPDAWPTATNRPLPKATPRSCWLVGELRSVQVTASGEVMTRPPLPTAT